MGEPHPRGGSAAGRLGRPLLLSVGCVLGVGCALDTFGFAEGQSNLETEPADTQEITAPGPTSSGGGSSDGSSTGSTVCGNGEVEPGEDCDDTNAISDDGCQVGCVETKAVAIAAGGGHTCVLLVDGGVRCWGAGGDGRLGIGSTNTIGDDEPIQSVPRVDLGGAASVLTLGGSHSCALMGSDVRCWGDAGALGTGIDMDIGDNESPAEGGTAMVGGPVRQVDAGAAFTCAVLTNGGVWCWGSCLDGECGFGTTGEFDIGAEVEVGGTVRSLSAGLGHVCAVMDSGGVRCWGYGNYGGLGYPSVTDIGATDVPADHPEVSLGGGQVEEVSAGQDFTCAILANGNVRCWGAASDGQLGYGSSENIGDDEYPSEAGILAFDAPAVDICSGFGHSCVLLETGKIHCWGANSRAQLGSGDLENIGDDESVVDGPPVDVGGDVLHIACGGFHTCALLADTTLRCWGDPSNGALGYGDKNIIGNDEYPSSQPGVPYYP